MPVTAPVLATAIAGEGSVDLTWGAVAAVDGYKVKYGASSGVYTVEIDVDDVLTYSVTGLAFGVPYYFVIVAYVGLVESSVSNELSATPEYLEVCAYVSGGEVRKYTTTITGLHHLEGAIVSIVADGRRVDDKTVTNGTITLDEAACIVQLGFRYRGIVIPFNLVVTDQLQNSISFAKNVSTIALLLSHTLGLKYGTSLYNLQEIPEEELGQVSGTPLKPFTGVVSLPNDDKWEIDKEIICVQDQPYPCLLNAMNVTIEVGEK